MGNLVGNIDSAKAVIFVDDNGCDILTGIKICEVEDAMAVYFVDINGDSIN